MHLLYFFGVLEYLNIDELRNIAFSKSNINLDDLIAYMDDKNYQSQQKLMQNYRSEWGA